MNIADALIVMAVEDGLIPLETGTAWLREFKAYAQSVPAADFMVWAMKRDLLEPATITRLQAKVRSVTWACRSCMKEFPGAALHGTREVTCPHCGGEKLVRAVLRSARMTRVRTRQVQSNDGSRRTSASASAPPPMVDDADDTFSLDDLPPEPSRRTKRVPAADGSTASVPRSTPPVLGDATTTTPNAAPSAPTSERRATQPQPTTPSPSKASPQRPGTKVVTRQRSAESVRNAGPTPANAKDLPASGTAFIQPPAPLRAERESARSEPTAAPTPRPVERPRTAGAVPTQRREAASTPRAEKASPQPPSADKPLPSSRAAVSPSPKSTRRRPQTVVPAPPAPPKPREPVTVEKVPHARAVGPDTSAALNAPPAFMRLMQAPDSTRLTVAASPSTGRRWVYWLFGINGLLVVLGVAAMLLPFGTQSDAASWASSLRSSPRTQLGEGAEPGPSPTPLPEETAPSLSPEDRQRLYERHVAVTVLVQAWRAAHEPPETLDWEDVAALPERLRDIETRFPLYRAVVGDLELALNTRLQRHHQAQGLVTAGLAAVDADARATVRQRLDAFLREAPVWQAFFRAALPSYFRANE